MPTPQQTPSLLRSGTPPVQTLANRGKLNPDPRPYLVAMQDRKTARAAQRYPALFPHEPEDARITGTTRSLYRRLLALNLPTKANFPMAVSASASEAIKSVPAGFKIA